MQLDQTSLGLPLPHPDNNPRDTDVPRLRAALSLIDTLIVALQDNKAEKAELVAAIDALKGNAPAAYDTLIEIADKLNSNDDVVANILDVLGGKVAKTLAINGKQLTGDITLSKGDIGLPNVDNTPDANKPVSALQAEAIGKRIPYYASGSALPANDIGPIWHADYNDVLIWQTFNANGANYTGYASKDIGGIKTEMMSTPRSGWIKRNGTSLSRTAYAALRGWAMHNGLFVPAASWTAGIGKFCDNTDGTTFKVPDVRGEFGRYWDDGRGVDSGRGLGTWEDSDNKIHGHTGYTSTDGWHGHGLPGDIWLNRGPGVKMRDDGDGYWVNNQGSSTDGSGHHSHSVVVNASGGVESRGRNVSELAVIKF